MPTPNAQGAARQRRIAAARRLARRDIERKRRQADIDNPAQPIEEPAGEPAMDPPVLKQVDVEAPGVSEPSTGESIPTSVDSAGESTSGEGTPNTGDTEVTTPTATAGPNPGYEDADITVVESPSDADQTLEEAMDSNAVEARLFAALRLARLEQALDLPVSSDVERAQQIRATMGPDEVRVRMAALTDVARVVANRPKVATTRTASAGRSEPSLRSFVEPQPTVGYDESAGIFS